MPTSHNGDNGGDNVGIKLALRRCRAVEERRNGLFIRTPPQSGVSVSNTSDIMRWWPNLSAVPHLIRRLRRTALRVTVTHGYGVEPTRASSNVWLAMREAAIQAPGACRPPGKGTRQGCRLAGRGPQRILPPADAAGEHCGDRDATESLVQLG